MTDADSQENALPNYLWFVNKTVYSKIFILGYVIMWLNKEKGSKNELSRFIAKRELGTYTDAKTVNRYISPHFLPLLN